MSERFWIGMFGVAFILNGFIVAQLRADIAKLRAELEALKKP